MHCQDLNLVTHSTTIHVELPQVAMLRHTRREQSPFPWKLPCCIFVLALQNP